MPFGLVGTTNVSQGSPPFTPTWSVDENRDPGNVLICWAIGQAGGPASPISDALTDPFGWTRIIAGSLNGNNGCNIGFYWRVGSGLDAAPILSGGGAVVVVAQLGEFTGGTVPIGIDERNSGGTATITNTLADRFPFQLVLAIDSLNYGTAQTTNLTATFNNGAGSHLQTNNAESVGYHWLFDWGVTTTIGGPDSHTVTGISGFPVQFHVVVSLQSAASAPSTNAQGRRR